MNWLNPKLVSTQANSELEKLQSLLTTPTPPIVFISSPSSATISLLKNILVGFKITSTSSLPTLEEELGNAKNDVDFIIVDHQSEASMLELSESLGKKKVHATEKSKIIHLFTPTSETLSHYGVGSAKTQMNVIRMTKPPRRFKLLQMLAVLKNVPHDRITLPKTDISRAMDDIALAKRSVYGNVLIAEGS